MLGANANVRVFLYRGPCDMRRQMNGLSTMVREEFGREPESGDLFVFRNRRADMVKVLFYDKLGCCLLAKRLHEGRFRIAMLEGMSSEGPASLEISQSELASLLSRAEIAERARPAA